LIIVRKKYGDRLLKKFPKETAGNWLDFSGPCKLLRQRLCIGSEQFTKLIESAG